jgi:hypothetical protein
MMMVTGLMPGSRLSQVGFVEGYRGYFRAEEFSQFRNELSELYSSLKGEACFESMEDWLNIKVHGDGLGHMTA